MAYYLKYRPQKLADLDLKEVREGLSRALSAAEVPHAFLFAGPRGTGKTSAARIVAKAINCEKKKASQGKSSPRVGELASEPCNTCDSCLSITAGTNLDILEIDAASNRGIDDIRNLREKIRLAPVKAKYKVYIIDEAHMLTGEAFNALLKTLEEPPKHAIFVLCTTEPQKLPLTIISRCLQFNFRRARTEELMVGLKKIIKAEKVDIGEKALKKIARSADGSFRDSQKILEQLSFEKGKITVEKVNKVLGQVRGAGPEKLLEYLVKKDARGAVLEIGRVVEKGVNLRWYSEQLLEMLRRILLAELGITEGTEFKEGTEKLNMEEIKYLIEIFSKAVLELKTAIISQLPLEMGVVEWCEGEKVAQVAQVEQDLPSNPSNPSSPSSSSSDPNLTFDSVCQKWPEVLQAVGPKNHSIQAFLRATRPKEFDGETLILEVFYEFHKTQLESEKCRRLIEETAEVILKTPVKVKCVLGEKPASKSIAKPPLSSDEKYHLSLPSQSAESADDDIMSIAEEIFGKTAD